MSNNTPPPTFPKREKMFTFAGNLTIECRATLNHIRAKHPTMLPESPPLDKDEAAWLMAFIDEWAKRMERGLLSRKLRRGREGKKQWRGQL